MFLWSPLEKKPSTAFENSCQTTGGRKETHRRHFFCRAKGIYTKKVGDLKGEREEKAQKSKTENTDLATRQDLCSIGSRRELFLHQQAFRACHIRRW